MTEYPSPLPHLLNLPIYLPGEKPGKEQGFRLASNENPQGCSPLALQALQDKIAEVSLYPDGGCLALREAIADKFDLDPDSILCGAGSDEIFRILIAALLAPGEAILQTRHSFLLYSLLAQQAGGEVVSAPENGHDTNIDAMLELVGDNTRLLFLANPNNPTGSWLKRDELLRLHAGLPSNVVLVLDGAYAEYVTDPEYDCGLKLFKQADNVVTTRTFSKIHGLAGMRIGWCHGPARLIRILHKVRLPFNVSSPGQAAAIAALADERFIADSAADNAIQRQRLYQGLERLGLQPEPSQGNFVLACAGDAKMAGRIDRHLRQNSIIVRRLDAYQMPEYLRISVGSAAGNDALLQALESFGK